VTIWKKYYTGAHLIDHELQVQGVGTCVVAFIGIHQGKYFSLYSLILLGQTAFSLLLFGGGKRIHLNAKGKKYQFAHNIKNSDKSYDFLLQHKQMSVPPTFLCYKNETITLNEQANQLVAILDISI